MSTRPAFPASGAQRTATRIRRLSTLAVASDPGLNRLRSGLAGACCVSFALAVELAVTHLIGIGGTDKIVFLMMGGIVGMLGSRMLIGNDLWASVRSAAFFPVALGAGSVVGILVAANRTASLIAFVGVMFIAVYIRRFGMNFFFGGFLIWIGFFLSDFLHATFADLGAILLAVLIATVVVLGLCVAVFRPHPKRTLARIFRSTRARARSLADSCSSLLEAGPVERDAAAAERQVARARAHFREAALMSDGWAAHAPALPVGWDAASLRRLLLDTELDLDRLTVACTVLATEDEPQRRQAAECVNAYAAGDDAYAAIACARLKDAARRWPASARRQADHLIMSLTHLTAPPPSREAVDAAEEFTPATRLMLGNLPGSASVAREVAARGTQWNPLSRLQMTTRQAIQVAVAGTLAVIAGSALDERRYYWAVIAAFVAFTGTGTRAETFRKSTNRVLGTLVGLGAGVLTANLTSGHTLWALVVIVGSIFCGFYLVRVSYAYMIFFITIMVSQLYSLLGEFSDELLLLRLEETTIGAAIGIAVALVVTPLSTRDTIRHAEQAVLGAAATALRTAARCWEASRAPNPRELDGLMLAADHRLQQLDLVAGPLIRASLWERRPRLIRHRLALFDACVRSTRELVTAARSHGEPSADVAGVYYYLSSAVAHRCSPHEDDHPETAERSPTLWRSDVDLPVVPLLIHEAGRLEDVLSELAEH